MEPNIHSGFGSKNIGIKISSDKGIATMTIRRAVDLSKC